MDRLDTRSNRIGFIFSTEVGLRTQYQNWRERVSRIPLNPEWIVIDWYKEGGWIERVPLLSRNLKVRLRCLQQLFQGLSRGPFDYLFIGAPQAAYYAQRWFGKTPYFLTLDATQPLLYAFGDHYEKYPSRLRLWEKLKQARQRRFFQRATAVFPWSRWAAQSLIEDYGVAPERIHVVPPGVDLQRWRVARPAVGETIHLLFVGGDFHRKGGDLLLEWAKTTPLTNWHLHLVTRDPVPEEHPRVTVYHNLSSNDPALVALYQKANVFVLPTRADCYSLAGIEAMACGLPVLLGNIGGVGEIVAEGETGHLLPPGDGAALARCLESLLQDPERIERMGRAARLAAEQRFDVEKNIHQVLQTIDQSLPTPAPRPLAAQ